MDWPTLVSPSGERKRLNFVRSCELNAVDSVPTELNAVKVPAMLRLEANQAAMLNTTEFP